MAGEACGPGCGYCGMCDLNHYETQCAECGDTCEGIWCHGCMARWRQQEVKERAQRAVSAAPLRESA